MRYIKIRYIIGTLAIIAIIVMNFTYAHNNYGIPKMNGITKANATTTAPAYREEKRTSYKYCPRYAYDVVIYSGRYPKDNLFVEQDHVYSGRYPKDNLFVEQDHGWLSGAYILRRIPFYSLNLSEAFTEATYYANQYNAEHDSDRAIVDNVSYVTEIYTEAYFIVCEKGGKLPNCKSSDLECEPLDYRS